MLVLALTAGSPGPLLADSVRVRAASGGQQIEPCAAVTAQGWLVVWVDAQPLGREVRAATSTDAETWQQAGSPSGPGAIDEAMRPSCAAWGDEVVVAWATAQDGDHDVWAARSNTGGATFGRPVKVVGGPGGQLAPRVAMGPDGRAYLVFHDSFGSTADDGGVAWHVGLTTQDGSGAWSPPVTVDRERALAVFPAVAVSEDGAVQVAWLAPESGTIVGAWSGDRGARFDPPVELGTRAEGPPEIAWVGPGATVVYARSSTAADQRDPRLFVQEASYLDVAAVVTSSSGRVQAVGVANTARALNQLQPSIASRAVVWLDHGTAGVRRIRAQIAGGEGDVALGDSDGAREVALPSVACDAQSCVVAWSEEGEGGGFDVRAQILR